MSSQALAHIIEEVNTLTPEERRRWEAARRSHDLLIGRGRPLAEAESMVRRFPEEIPGTMGEFIKKSGRKARLRQTLTVLAATVFAVIALVAVYFGQQSVRSQAKAEEQHQRAEVMFGTAEELLEGTSAFQRLGPCLTLSEKSESLAPPLVSQSYFVGRWHVLQDQGSTDMDWYANGTCVFRNVFQGWTLIDRKYLPHGCNWSFQKISDHVFQINAQFVGADGQVINNPMQFQIINPMRIHNIVENYDAFRIGCMAPAGK